MAPVGVSVARVDPTLGTELPFDTGIGAATPRALRLEPASDTVGVRLLAAGIGGAFVLETELVFRDGYESAETASP